MKYKTFRNLALAGGSLILAGLFGTCYYLTGSNQSSPSQTLARTASSSTTAALKPVNTANTATSYSADRTYQAPATPALPAQRGQRRADQLILGFLANSTATSEKIKDAFPGEAFKVNFYCDDGSPTWTRLKIDLDRDGKDDEKWDLKDGQPVKRRVATRDDEQYDREYRWRGGQWVEKK